MSNKNSNKNKQTKSVESCIEYIDGKPIVKVLFAWGYCTFVFKKELEQKFNKFKKQYSNDIPFNVMLEQFFNHLKDNCNFDFNNDGLSPEDYKTVLDLIAQDGYAKSSCCKDFYFTQVYGDFDCACKLHVANVDVSRPWTIENYDGVEYVRYLDAKDYKKDCPQLNYYIQE